MYAYLLENITPLPQIMKCNLQTILFEGLKGFFELSVEAFLVSMRECMEKSGVSTVSLNKTNRR
jgi:hypothetical protein